MFDPAMSPLKNALFQAAAHGTAPEVDMLVSPSFDVGDKGENPVQGLRQVRHL